MTTILLSFLTLASVLPLPRTRDFNLAPGEIIRVTLHDAGDATPIVIVPGMMGSAYSFRHVAPVLAERGHPVFIIDVLGSGGSGQPARADYSLTAQSRRVETVLDSLGLQNSVIVAHAVSGSIAYRLGIRRPDLVRSIVGIDAGATEHPATSGLRKAMRFAPLIKLLGAKRILTGKVKDGLIDSSYDPTWVTPEVIAEYAAPYRTDAGQALRVLQAMAGAKEPEPLAPSLPGLSVPVLLMVGTAPSTLAPEKIEVLRAGIPNFTLRRVEQAGVFIQEEQPQALIDAILEQIQVVESSVEPRAAHGTGGRSG